MIKSITKFLIIFFIFQQLKSQISQIDQNEYNAFCDETLQIQLLQRTQQCEPKYNLWPYKRRNTGAALPNTIGLSILPRYTSIQNLKEIGQELQLLERTQECEPKYDLWPY